MTRKKGKILKVGKIENGRPKGFEFDCTGLYAGAEVRPDETILYAGWTVDELRQIADAVIHDLNESEEF